MWGWLAAAAGAVAVARDGGALPVLAAAVLGLSLVGRRLPLPIRARLAQWVGLSAGLPALGVLWAGETPRVALATLLFALLLARLLAPSGDIRGIVWLAGLLLAASTAGDAGWWVAAGFWSLAAIGALAKGPIGVAGPWFAVLCVAASLWSVAPRRELPPPEVNAVGFADVLTPGRPPVGNRIDAEELRVMGPADWKGPLYLRGAALAEFDGANWRAESGVWAEPPTVGDGETFQVSALRPSAALFTVGTATGVTVTADTYRDAEHALVVDTPVKHWQFSAHPPFGEGAVVDAEPPATRHLAVPAGLVASLSSLVAPSDLPDAARVAWISSHFSGFRWSLLAPAEQPADVVDFLTRSREGHCAWFASGFAVLARASGVPARVVTGYRAVPESPGVWVARGADAHAWVEVWLDGKGWTVVDATPAVPDVPAPEPAAPDLAERAGVVLIVAAAALAAWLGTRRRRAQARRPVDSTEIGRLWGTVVRRLEAGGWRVSPDVPAWTSARIVARRASDAEAAEALCELALLWSAVRWGGRDEAEVMGEARRLAAVAGRLGAVG